MEDRAKCFHVSVSIVRSSRKDILTVRKRDGAGENKAIFTVFSRVLTVLYSLMRANQTQRKKNVDVFRSESERDLFCYLLVTFEFFF